MKKTFDVVNRKNIYGFVVAAFLILLGNALFVMYTDPFYQYHAPRGRIPICLENAVYQTPGAARNLVFRDAIVGSSMTENFHTSWFDEGMGWDTMKLSYSGADCTDLEAILSQVFAENRSVNHIVMDLNEFQLTDTKNAGFVERPAYLYDDKIWNDWDYLFNFGVAIRGYRSLLDGWKGIPDNIDTAYTWEEESLFGREAALRASRETRLQLLNMPLKVSDRSEKIACCAKNIEYIIPYIQEHPETEFIFIFPPYSMLYWEQKMLTGELENILEVYKHAMSSLLEYENVRVFYFQNETEIIENLDNYRDACHHHPKYNRYMYESIRDGKKEMTMETLEETINEFYGYLSNFDYSVYWSE